MSQAVKYQQDYGCATYNHFSAVFVALKHSTALSSEETNAVHKYGQQPHNSAEHTQKATWGLHQYPLQYVVHSKHHHRCFFNEELC
jgi:hypothetical protein